MQRSIELLIGRLITDEDFRRSFVSDPHQTLATAVDRGLHLTRSEMAALVETDPGLWETVARMVNPRLQKASLDGTPDPAEETKPGSISREPRPTDG